MKLGSAVLLFLLIFFATTALADTTAWQQVWKSETATENVTVVGRALTMTVDDGHTMSAVASVTAAQGKVRFDYQTFDHRWSLIDDGNRLLRLQPDLRRAFTYERPTLAVDRKLAERNYEAKEVGEEVIAGRTAWQVEITPRGGGSVVLRLWLDKENSFALRRERYNVEGRRTSGTEYTEVQFGPKVAADVFDVPRGWTVLPPPHTDRKLSVSELSRRLGYSVAAPEYVPQGYVLLGGYERKWGRGRLRLAELRYTDGLKLLSVFQHPAPEPPPGGGGARHGGGRRGGRGHGRGGPAPPRPGETTLLDRGTEKVLRYFGPERGVTAIGDLAADDLIRVAKSVPQG
ncbi:MAG: hypothetical protein JXA57_02595 [Armatimonadetes bacterium]|nr:hypothetical protein [Armatimonadota bacterium]